TTATTPSIISVRKCIGQKWNSFSGRSLSYRNGKVSASSIMPICWASSIPTCPNAVNPQRKRRRQFPNRGARGAASLSKISELRCHAIQSSGGVIPEPQRRRGTSQLVTLYPNLCKQYQLRGPSHLLGMTAVMTSAATSLQTSRAAFPFCARNLPEAELRPPSVVSRATLHHQIFRRQQPS